MIKLADKLYSIKKESGQADTGRIGKETLDAMLKWSLDSIALLGYATQEINNRRRELIKPDLNESYQSLCSKHVQTGAWLFGEESELAKKLKDLEDTNKLSKKLVKRGYGPGQKRYKPYYREQHGPYKRQGKQPTSTKPSHKSKNARRGMFGKH